MASLNKVLLIGNITKDPEVKYLPSGIAVGELRLAVTERFTGKDGEQKEQTCFVDVVVWARQAETCGEYLRKGSPIFVEGRLQLDQWKTKEGENRSKLRVRADRVQFLSKPSSDGAVRDGGGAGGAVEPDPGVGTEPAAGGDTGPAGDDDNLPF